MSHRDKRLDSYIGKNLNVTFTDGVKYSGIFGFNDESGLYVLKGCKDEQGLPKCDMEFRKSLIRRIEVY